MQPHAISNGTVVDRYTVESVLGEGGMAIVYRVRHNLLGTHHALKILTIGNTEVQRRLRQEGELQAKLHHPNVVAVTDVLTLHGAPALVMEYVEGPSLEQFLRQHRLTVAQADALARGILDGVAAAHARGLVHRDLKPGNILLQITDDGFLPKVADFGLAKELGQNSKTRTGSTMGTPHYMSPEQIRDAKYVGPASDVFALGAILYEMLTNERAFGGDDLLEIFNRVVSGQVTPVRSFVPDVPPHMEAAIGRALSVRPEDRFPTVAALRAAWTGEAEGTAAARPMLFDPKTIASSRSLVTAASGASSEASVAAPSGETFTASKVVEVPARATESIDRPAVTPSLGSSQAVVAAGLGGMVLIGLGVAAAVVALVLGGALLYQQRGATGAPPPEPVAVAAPPAAPTTASAPGPVASPTEPVPPTPGSVAGPVEAPRPSTPRGTEPSPDPLVAPPLAPEAEGDGAAVVAPAPSEPEPPAPAPPVPAEEEPELTAFLASPDPAERRRGVTNLRNRHDDESIRLLNRVVRDEADPTVRLEAVKALVWCADERNADFALLMQGLVTASGLPEAYALPAVQALGRNADALPDLQKGLRHVSPRVRLAALEAVQTVAPRAPEGSDPRAFVSPLALDANPQVSKKATAVLAAIGD